MTKKYVVSLDGGDWSGGFFDTRDEAIKSGVDELEGASFWIGETRPPMSPELAFSFSNIFDAVLYEDDYCIDAAEDYISNLDGVGAKLKDELEAKVQPIIKEWLEKHSLMPKFFIVENEEKIEPSEL